MNDNIATPKTNSLRSGFPSERWKIVVRRTHNQAVRTLAPIELAKVIHNLRAENSSYLQEFSTAKKVRSVQQRREETAGQTHV